MYPHLLILLCLLWTTASAAQTPRANLGTLTCTLAPSEEPDTAPQKNITPQSPERSMRCAFKPTANGAEHTFTGTIRQVGAGSDELKGKQVLIWVVQGPSDTKLKPGLLAQTYVSGSRDGGARGAASNSLVGERHRDIIMQPETVNAGPQAPPSVTVMELKVEMVPA
jgi:hypothetical protein